MLMRALPRVRALPKSYRARPSCQEAIQWAIACQLLLLQIKWSTNNCQARARPSGRPSSSRQAVQLSQQARALPMVVSRMLRPKNIIAKGQQVQDADMPPKNERGAKNE